MSYIDEDVLRERIEKICYVDYGSIFDYDAHHAAREVLRDVLDILDEQESADVAKIRRGRWVDHGVRDWRCSECGGEVNKTRVVDGYCYNDLPKYCPDCGAKMETDVKHA
jgi:rubrerythrin